jgi:lipopolysaccharide/colanic/teichoic acid biosynthesis glycosyltransferase
MYNSFGKRIIDLALTFPALIVLSPIIILVVLAVRIRLGSPVLFRQVRPGLHCNPFTILKFRTMNDECDVKGKVLPDAERLTSLGRFLRATSLDELPELLNVLRGEMSLVGPRPLLSRYTPYFSQRERLRFLVRPGITGLSQVRGRNDLSWKLRLANDVEYVRRCSLALDIQIIFITIWRVITRRGLRVDPGANMLDFDEERKGTRISQPGS